MTLEEAYEKIIEIGKADMRMDAAKKYETMFNAPYVPKLEQEWKHKIQQPSEQLCMFGDL